MTHREVLFERYQDALFALLMDEVEEAEGQKALAETERLKESGELTILPITRKRCLQTIARERSEERMWSFGTTFSKVVSKVAVAALIAMLMFTTAFASFEDFRVKTLNLVIEAFDDHIEFNPSSGTGHSAQEAVVPQMSVSWIPEGFTLTNEGADSFTQWEEYRADGSDAAITVALINNEFGGINLSTDGTAMQSVNIRDAEAFLITDGEVKQMIWNLPEYPGWIAYVVGENITEDILLKVAEGVVVE